MALAARALPGQGQLRMEPCMASSTQNFPPRMFHPECSPRPAGAKEAAAGREEKRALGRAVGAVSGAVLAGVWARAMEAEKPAAAAKAAATLVAGPLGMEAEKPAAASM